MTPGALVNALDLIIAAAEALDATAAHHYSGVQNAVFDDPKIVGAGISEKIRDGVTVGPLSLNKLIAVDGQRVLVGSRNWSDSAVPENREAGLWLEHPGIAKYFGDIFESDWKGALHAGTRANLL